ncbi:MAG: leucine-rich repeat domain-containing protein [Bacteroidaceae bacterium]|nr:leucine-rich repeat domain-containing protein [Bacteroidaceae bacterium]
MKRKLLLTLLAIGLSHVAIQAQTLAKRGLVYELHDNGTATLIGTNARIIGERTVDAEIKSGTKTYRVNNVRARAMTGQTYLTKLIIDATLDTLGMGAFRDCERLTEVVANGNVKYLEAYVFANTAITQIDISAWTPTKYGNGLFADCTALTEAHLPAGLKTLPDCTFAGCTSLTEPNLESLALTAIGEHALSDCQAITALKLPATLTTIGADAFAGCTSLTEPNLPQKVTTIGHLAFKNCTALETIELPALLTSTGVSPFWGCTALREVTLPASISGVENKYMFDNCPALERILVDAANTRYRSQEGVLYMRSQNMIVAYPAQLSHSVHPQLPDASQPLAPGALIGCEMDRWVSAPRLTTQLPREAFANTTGMELFSTTESTTMRTVGPLAFHGSKDLVRVGFSSRLSNVSSAAFQLTPLYDIYILSSTPPTLDYSAFDDRTLGSSILHVASGRSNAYRESTTWGRFTNIEDDGATEVLAPEAETTEPTAPCYNLQGIRVAHPQKGIYIRDGKKLMR